MPKQQGPHAHPLPAWGMIQVELNGEPLNDQQQVEQCGIATDSIDAQV